jgi:hypothetical protein
MTQKSFASDGSHYHHFFTPERATIASGLAAILEVVNGALQSPTSYGVVLFIFFLILGTSAIILFNTKKHGVGNTMIIVVSLIIISVLLFGIRSMAAQGAIKNPFDVPPPTYYMKVIIYVDTNGDGTMDGRERPEVGVTVTTRDPTDATASHVTDEKGEKLILLRNPGEISVGVCGVYQTHLIGDQNTDMSHAYPIEIGLSPGVKAACQ